MKEPIPADQRPPTIPWGGIILVALAVFGAISLASFLLSTIFGIVKLAIVVVVAVAIISMVMGRKTSR